MYIKKIDRETANRINESFPPDWDMDRIFRKSYRKFLEAEGKESDSVSHVDVIRTKGRNIFTVNRLTTAACVLLFMFIVKSVPKIDESPEVDNFPLVTSTFIGTTKLTASASFTTSQTETTGTTTEITTGATTQTSSSSIATTTSTITAETVAETEPPEYVAEEETAEESPQPEKAETTEMTTTATVAITTTAETTTETTTQPHGYFTLEKETRPNVASDFRLTYSLNGDDETEPVEHSKEFENFEVNENFSDDYTVMNLSLQRIDGGSHFSFTVRKYEYFEMNFTKIEGEPEFFEINGNPAVSVIISNNLCCLYWDDCCHVCTLVGLYSDYDEMISIAENFK